MMRSSLAACGEGRKGAAPRTPLHRPLVEIAESVLVRPALLPLNRLELGNYVHGVPPARSAAVRPAGD
jgi:hypothetical protein